MKRNPFNPYQRIYPFLGEQNITHDLRIVLTAISRAGKHIAHSIRNSDLGYSNSENSSGEQQLALDVLSDRIFCDHLKSTEVVAKIASEEQESSIELSVNGKYSVVFDPLDGSSLVSSNLAIGSIFGIFEGKEFLGKSGRDLVASGYILYGPQTLMVIATEEGVWEFTENAIGEFLLSREDIQLEKEAKYFAPGNLRAVTERNDYKTVIDHLSEKPLTLRYSGGMVPDIHLALSKGSGIFLYPSYSKYPKGKLRLLFECAPLAFLVEKCGGAALDDQGDPVLDIVAETLHQRTSIFIGSKKTVEECVDMLQHS